MHSQFEVGDKVPVGELGVSIEGAIRRARTGRCTFIDLGTVEVEFTVRPDRTDVRVVGMGETGVSEFRVVGDVHYRLTDEQDRPWKWLDLTSTAPGDRFVVDMGRDSTAIGTPLGLVTAMRGQEAVVVGHEGPVTTFQISVRFEALARAHGDLSGDATDERIEETLWDVGHDFLVERVRIDGSTSFDFAFADWGSAPEVIAPGPDETESNNDWLLRGF